MADTNKKYLTYTDLTSMFGGLNNYLALRAPNGTDYPYYPISQYDTLLSINNVDNTNAVKSITSAVTYSSEIGYHIIINAMLNNYIVNKKTASNAWYPMAIAGKQYANMRNGDCLPIYYCSGVTVNPYQGKFKVNDLILISGDTEISVANLIVPSTVTCTMNPITIEINFEGEYFTFSNFYIYISTPYDYVYYNIGDYGGEYYVGTISPSKNTLTIDSNYASCNFHFEGYIHGSGLDSYYATVQGIVNGEFDVNTMDSEIGIGPLTDAVLPNHSFPYSNVYIEIHWA